MPHVLIVDDEPMMRQLTGQIVADMGWTFDTMLSEARKYRLCLILAHQYLGQLNEGLRKAIFGNVGTTVVFPVGPENGDHLEREFYPPFNRQDLVDQPGHHIYLKLAIDSKTSRPFSAYTLPPFYAFLRRGARELIVRRSRQRYGAKTGMMEARGKGVKAGKPKDSPPNQRILL